MRFDELDIEQGFVLSGADAFKYLKWLAGQVWERAVEESAIDIEHAVKEWEDVAEMAQNINDLNMEWVRFYECAMSASGIAFKEMKDA